MGRLANTTVPKSNPLLPLFEAVVDSIHATQERFDDQVAPPGRGLLETRAYADFTPGPDVKIFDNADFGFQRITVERPLKLNFQASPDRLARLEDESAWQGLDKSKKKGEAAVAEIAQGQALQECTLAALSSLKPDRLYLSRDDFGKDLKAALKSHGVKLPGPLEWPETLNQDNP